MSVRLVVADDNLIARQGILQLLALEPEFEVVASCGDLPEAARGGRARAAGRGAHRHPDAAHALRRGRARRHRLRQTPSRGRRHRPQPVRGARRAVAAGRAPTDAATCSRSASTTCRTARRRSRRSPRGRRHRPHARRRASQGQGGDRTLAARRAVATRAPGSRRDRPGEEQHGDRRPLVLSKRAVEKHINSIFLKLGLGFTDDVSKRVKATLLYLRIRAAVTGRYRPQPPTPRARHPRSA